MAQQIDVGVKRADVAPIDLVGRDVEVVVAEVAQAGQHRVDLSLLRDEGIEGGGLGAGLGHGALHAIVSPYTLLFATDASA